jgi:hypothetical protein
MHVPPNVCEYYQRDIEKTNKATADRARERLRQEKTATEGNNPREEEEDEEAQLQRALHLSRVKAEYQQGWNIDVVHTSIEGVVVAGGDPMKKMFKRQLHTGRITCRASSHWAASRGSSYSAAATRPKTTTTPAATTTSTEPS